MTDYVLVLKPTQEDRFACDANYRAKIMKAATRATAGGQRAVIVISSRGVVLQTL